MPWAGEPTATGLRDVKETMADFTAGGLHSGRRHSGPEQPRAAAQDSG
jgi:hypothetical protein